MLGTAMRPFMGISIFNGHEHLITKAPVWEDFTDVFVYVAAEVQPAFEILVAIFNLTLELPMLEPM